MTSKIGKFQKDIEEETLFSEDVSYKGIRLGYGNMFKNKRGKCLVMVVDPEGKELSLFPILRSTRPEQEPEFEWGYRGTALGNLSLSVLADYLGTEEIPPELYLPFKNEFLLNLPFEGWEITGKQISNWLNIFVKKSEGVDQRT